MGDALSVPGELEVRPGVKHLSLHGSNRPGLEGLWDKSIVNLFAMHDMFC